MLQNDDNRYILCFSLAHEKSQISKEDIENSLDGNICRCTGYRSVLDAFKSLSCEGQSECVDIEVGGALYCTAQLLVSTVSL